MPLTSAALVYSSVPPQAHTFTAGVVGVDELNSGKLQGALNRIAFDFSQHVGENCVGKCGDSLCDDNPRSEKNAAPYPASADKEAISRGSLRPLG